MIALFSAGRILVKPVAPWLVSTSGLLCLPLAIWQL